MPSTLVDGWFLRIYMHGLLFVRYRCAWHFASLLVGHSVMQSRVARISWKATTENMPRL